MEQLLHRSSRSPSPSQFRRRPTTPPPPLQFPPISSRHLEQERGPYHAIGQPADQYQMAQFHQAQSSSLSRPMCIEKQRQMDFSDDDYGHINRYYGSNDNGERYTDDEEPLHSHRARRLPMVSTASSSARYGSSAKTSPRNITDSSPRQGHYAPYGTPRRYNAEIAAPPSPSPRSPTELNLYSDRAGYSDRSGYDAPANSANREKTTHFTTYSLPPVSTVPMTYNRRPLVTGATTKHVPPRTQNSLHYMPMGNDVNSAAVIRNRHIIQAQPGNMPLSDSDETDSVSADHRWPMI
jgi:hypothetical protein